MLFRTITVNKGLVTQLDSDLEEAAKAQLHKETSRLARKNATDE
jgi:hypothetical protein